MNNRVFAFLKDAFTRWLLRGKSSETLLLVGLAILVGLGSAAGVWLFKRLIDLFHALFFKLLAPALAPLGPWTVALLPVLGGLLVGWIVYRWGAHERHHGVAGIMETVSLSGGRLDYRSVPLKAAVSALSIGAGASVGPEDPSVQIGANLGSLLGQLLRLPEERVRALVAAAFNAPIAGVFFAVEIILGELGSAALSLVVLSAVISAVLTQAITGVEPAFHVPGYTFGAAWELPLYLALGLLAGITAAAYIYIMYGARDLFSALKVTPWLKPAIAGLAVGAAGIFLPQVFGTGYDTIANILSGDRITLGLLLALLAAKLLLTPVSIGGGFLGGVFAPALFIGAALGGAFGYACQAVLPGIFIPPGAFALVGMAAVLAGTVHAPLTAILLMFEMTNDYRIILPLMFAVVISLLVSERLQRESIYTLSLQRQGVRLERGRDVEVLEGIQVAEMMSTSYQALKTSDTLASALDTFTRTHAHGLPVLNPAGELAGMFTLADLEKAQAAGADLAARSLGEFCTLELVVAHPDETLSSAVRKMSAHGIGRLPVVEAGEPSHIIGLLHRADVIRAYDKALALQASQRHRAQKSRLSSYTRLVVDEARIAPGSACAGSPVSQVAWPEDVILTSLRRGGQVLIPHGSTTLLAGDVIVFTAKNGLSAAAVLRLCREPGQGASVPVK